MCNLCLTFFEEVVKCNAILEHLSSRLKIVQVHNVPVPVKQNTSFS